MVLVDINSMKKNEDAPLVKAINSLVTSNEFNHNEYGSNAKWIAALDSKLKEILDRNYADPAEKVKRYNRELQKYLFHVTNPSTSSVPPDMPETTEADFSDVGGDMLGNTVPPSSQKLYKTTVPTTPQTSRKSIFEEPASGRKPHKTNLPRETPKQARLRNSALRRKNSRLKGFLENWDEYV